MRSFAFQVDVAPSSQALQIHFALRRGSLSLVQTTPASIPHLSLFDGLRRLFLVWPEPLQTPQKVVVRIQSNGEEVRVVREEWTRRPDLVRELIRIPLPTPWGTLLGLLRALFTSVPSPAANILAWRDGRAGPPFQADQTFFNALERQTWVDDTRVWTPIGGIPDALRTRALAPAGVLAQLAAGLTQRQASVANVSPYAPAVGNARDDLRNISTIFSTCAAPLTPGALQLAHLRFATGHAMLLTAADLPELDPEILDWKGKAVQPDSGLLFYFAELADLCIQSNVDRGFWEPLYPAFVHSLKCFWECYGTASSKMVLGQEVFKPYPFTPAIAEADLALGLAAFPVPQVTQVHRNYVKQYLDPVP